VVRARRTTFHPRAWATWPAWIRIPRRPPRVIPIVTPPRIAPQSCPPSSRMLMSGQYTKPAVTASGYDGAHTAVIAVSDAFGLFT